MSDSVPHYRRRGRYDAVLPKGLELHYDEEDPNLLSLRSKAALLEAFLKDTLSKFDEPGSAVNIRMVRENIYALVPLCSGPVAQQLIENIAKELARASEQEALQVKARSIVRDFVDVIKAETNRLVAIGGALTLQQIGGIVNGIMTVALNFMASDNHKNFEDDKSRALSFIGAVKRNVLSTPGIAELQELHEASSVRIAPKMISAGQFDLLGVPAARTIKTGEIFDAEVVND